MERNRQANACDFSKWNFSVKKMYLMEHVRTHQPCLAVITKSSRNHPEGPDIHSSFRVNDTSHNEKAEVGGPRATSFFINDQTCWSAESCTLNTHTLNVL